MPGIARNTVDIAGGLQVGPPTTVFVNGATVQTVGGSIAPHGDDEHEAAIMVTGSSTVFINGRQTCRAGDIASCGDVSTGSPNVIAN